MSEQDAKLSTEKRKKLPGKSFCGPNRSFPVNDCAHYTAALRLLSRYKGPGSKSSIRACIMRKGKAMGCVKKGDHENMSLEEILKTYTPEELKAADALADSEDFEEARELLSFLDETFKDYIVEDSKAKSLRTSAASLLDAMRRKRLGGDSKTEEYEKRPLSILFDMITDETERVLEGGGDA